MRLLTALSALLLIAAACDIDDTADTPPPDTTVTTTAPTTTAPTTTSTSAPTTLTDTTPTTAPPGEVTALSSECTSPEGFTIRYPQEWATNPGDVLPPCSRFHPEPFEVPEATDERVAAISAHIDPVPFTQVAAPDEQSRPQRAATAVDGRQTARLAYEAGQDSLWPEGTPLTLYAVDLAGEEQQSTLLVETVGLPGFQYERNQRVLDRMARSIDLDTNGISGDPNVVARYGGGAGAFSVEGEVIDDEACLRIPPDGEQICTEVPAADQLHTIQLEDLGPVLAGVAGEDVFAVTAELRDGDIETVLPAPIGNTDIGGFSFTVPLGEIERFVLTDIAGNRLRTIEPGP